MNTRTFSRIDQFINEIDKGLKTSFGPAPRAKRPNPASDKKENELSERDRELAGRLMRVNHAGEICAQGLYQGQALTARLPKVREKMEQAAAEENDHIAWTADRIKELGSHTSYLNPVWYISSFALGALAGRAGDKWSLGFVAETEKQVVTHLTGHLDKITPDDDKSRAILEQMREDEGKHATTAITAGAASFPQPIQSLMKFTSKIFTNTTYWV
ncbi:MAG: 2-polyprenyl-3-methyl-6-methoxy-1,4-benzoquinone monooxygenase [Acidiferrobacterales bacterium]